MARSPVTSRASACEPCGKLRMRAVEVVLEGDVFGEEIVAGDVDGGGVQRAAVLAGAAIVDHDRFAGVGIGAADGDVGLVDGEHFAIDAGRNGEHGAAGFGSHVERALNGVVIAGAVGGDVEGLVFRRNFAGHLGSGFVFRERNEAAHRSRAAGPAAEPGDLRDRRHRRPWVRDCRAWSRW